MSPRCMPWTPPCPYPTGEDCSPFFTITNTWLELLKFQLGLSKVMTKTNSPWLSAHRKEKKKTLAFKLSNETEEARKYLLTEWCLDKSKLESNPPIFQSEGLSVRVLSLSHVHLFMTPWAAACQVPLSMVFFRQEYWSRLPFPTPGNLPDPKIEPAYLASPALAGRFFTTVPPTKPIPGCSVQFSSVVSDSLRPHEPQHTRPPCPSPTPRVHPNPCPLSQWCHPTISSSVVLISSRPQSFPALRSFQISQLFTSGGKSTGVAASTSVLPMNTQDCESPIVFKSLIWTGKQLF